MRSQVTGIINSIYQVLPAAVALVAVMLDLEEVLAVGSKTVIW